MCKLGDIIVVNSYKGEDGKKIGRHSFVVFDDEKGSIGGLEYDFVAAVISSFKSQNQKRNKLKYESNIEISDDALKNMKLKKESYIKADQAYYFKKKNLDYYVLGTIDDKYLFILVNLIIKLSKEHKLKKIVNNL